MKDILKQVQILNNNLEYIINRAKAIKIYDVVSLLEGSQTSFNLAKTVLKNKIEHEKIKIKDS